MYMICNFQRLLKERSPHYKIGDIVFAEKEPLDKPFISHGICKDCFKISMADIDRDELKEIQDEGRETV